MNSSSSMLRSEAAAKQRVSAPILERTSVDPADWLILLLLAGACAAIRVWCLACKPFWFDECFSVEVARIDWRNFLHLLWWREANMSLYYVLLRIWLHFGQSPFFIRSLSVLISAVTVPAIYWLGKLLCDRRTGLVAATLFAFNAYDVRYGQEARSYALFVLLATLSSGFLISFLREPTRRNRIGYIAVSILAAYAHFYALLLIVVHWLAVRIRERNSPRSSQLRGAWIATAIGVAPLLIFVAKTGAGPIKWIQRPGLRDLANFYEQLAGGTWLVLAAYTVACVVAIIPLRKQLFARDQNWETWRCRFLLLWLIFPIVLTAVLSIARPVFLGRYMIFCLPAFVLLAAAGLLRLRYSWLTALAVVAVLLLAWQGVSYIYARDFDTERDASGEAVNFILDHSEPGDGIIFHIADTRIAYEFFRSLRAGRNTADPSFTVQVGPEILFPRHAAGLDYRDFTGKPNAEFVRSLAANRRRVWVMLMNNSPAGKTDPTTDMLTQVLAESFPKMARWKFAKVEVRVYSKE